MMGNTLNLSLPEWTLFRGFEVIPVGPEPPGVAFLENRPGSRVQHIPVGAAGQVQE